MRRSIQPINNWLLLLQTLKHLSPSKLPIFQLPIPPYFHNNSLTTSQIFYTPHTTTKVTLRTAHNALIFLARLHKIPCVTQRLSHRSPARDADYLHPCSSCHLPAPRTIRFSVVICVHFITPPILQYHHQLSIIRFQNAFDPFLFKVHILIFSNHSFTDYSWYLQCITRHFPPCQCCPCMYTRFSHRRLMGRCRIQHQR